MKTKLKSSDPEFENIAVMQNTPGLCVLQSIAMQGRNGK